MPLTHDRKVYGEPFTLPVGYQDRHVLIAGDTGAGKSVLLENAMLTNLAATRGPSILFDTKGGGTANEYLRAHFKAFGHLDDVIYFDLTAYLPALTFFDIRPLLDAGLPREEARSRKAGHYEEILAGVIGAEQFGQAAESVKAIRNHVRALFDPIHGSDAFSHADLDREIRRTHEEAVPPAVAEDRLETYFSGLSNRHRDVFNMVMGGATSRVETIVSDGRLAPIFDYVYPDDAYETRTADSWTDGRAAEDDDYADEELTGADVGDGDGDGVRVGDGDADGNVNGGGDGDEDGDGDGDGDKDEKPPLFDFSEILNQDCVVIFDFGGMEESAKRIITLNLLSNLWTALTARKAASLRGGPGGLGAGVGADGGTDGATNGERTAGSEPSDDPGAADGSQTDPGDLVPVNVYLEEAQDVAKTSLVDTLLSQGRSFGLSLVLGVQFPGQLESADPNDNTYREVLNETATIVTGRVRLDDDLMNALASAELPREAIHHRLNRIRSGEWLVRPGSAFGEAPPKTFLGRSLPAPAGHPASDHPLTDAEERAFESALDNARARTIRNHGLPHPAEPRRRTDGTIIPSSAFDFGGREEPYALTRWDIDSLLPHTTRFPSFLQFDENARTVVCRPCQNRYDPSIDGIRRGIECCHSFEDVDIDDIPTCFTWMKRSLEEVAKSEYSVKQLLFLQAVHNATQRRYDPLEFHLVYDSMIRLQEYVGVDTDEVEGLIDAGLLVRDTDHPHRLYTVTPEGREVIGEPFRKGLDYGHGKGDLGESSRHVFGVIVAERYLEEVYVSDPDSPVVTVSPYHELPGPGENRRLDVAGLDADGAVRVTVEVERINNDAREAIPADYDKMASCDPDEAIWIVMSQRDGYRVLEALLDPLDGNPRVEAEYASTTPPQQYRIDTPGLTAVYPAEYIRDHLVEKPAFRE